MVSKELIDSVNVITLNRENDSCFNNIKVCNPKNIYLKRKQKKLFFKNHKVLTSMSIKEFNTANET